MSSEGDWAPPFEFPAPVLYADGLSRAEAIEFVQSRVAAGIADSLATHVEYEGRSVPVAEFLKETP